jgi:RNA polymerase sigma factor (sigma-70 family)
VRGRERRFVFKPNPIPPSLRIQGMTAALPLLLPFQRLSQHFCGYFYAKYACGPGIYCLSSSLFNSKRRSQKTLAHLKTLAQSLHDNATMNTQLQDATLIALLDRVAKQDHAALKALYEQCASKLYGLALRVVTHRDWAEDVLQESFLTIWRSAGDYRASLSPPMAWLGLIVRSRGLDMLRRRASERSHLTQELDDTLADTLESDAETPLDTAQASEQAWALHQCLVQLERKQREVVSLAYVRDMSHSELAAQLQIPLGTVKTWIRRGLDQLRNCMSRFA